MEEKDVRKVEDESLKLRQGNISLVLNGYNDLFSDFDPRPNSERGLSDDFLIECRRAAREKEGNIELRLLMPGNKRDAREETIIKKRLKDFFKHHFHEEHKTMKEIKKQGLIWIIIGSIILVLSTLLYEYKQTLNLKFLMDFLFIISQPAGWFTFWEGLGKIFIVAKEETPDYDFYKKMSNANIYFLNY